MKQYHQLLQDIKEKGTLKSAARENMPGTISLFGYQMRFDLQEGFPLVTTKKISFKNIVVELLWFLKGDINIKYLVDNGCNIWNEDAYNYYLKVCKGKLPIELLGDTLDENSDLTLLTFEEFVTILKVRSYNKLPKYNNYTLGDCGYQYGKVWRDWQVDEKIFSHNVHDYGEEGLGPHIITKVLKDKENVDQLATLIKSLKTNPQGRRHIITAVDPAHDTNLALYWCHALAQWNCRPIPWETKLELAKRNPNVEMENLAITEAASGNTAFGFVPQYYLDCQMYQRSADVFLGVPYNIASYALLTEILAKICNMIPGDFIHTFGDVHIYEDHLDAVNEQLSRTPEQLPKLKIIDTFKEAYDELGLNIFDSLNLSDFELENYNPQPTIKARLSTGLKK